MHRLSLLAFAILTASIAVGCDPGFGVWFRNRSTAPVIVQFIDNGLQNGTGFLVGAQSIGGGYEGLGITTWSAHVRVVAPEGCRVLWEQEFHLSPSGVVLVDASGAVSLVTSGPETEPAESEIPIPAVKETKSCLPKGVEFSPVSG